MGERSVSNRKLENIRNIRVLENRNKGCERGLLGVCHLFPSVTRVWPHPDWWSVTGPNTVQIQIQIQIPKQIQIPEQIQYRNKYNFWKWYKFKWSLKCRDKHCPRHNVAKCHCSSAVSTGTCIYER